MLEERTRPHILVVDDEPGIRQLCGDVLRRSGYTAEAASDAAAALRRVEAGLNGRDQAVDLVLTDLRMKPLDGLAFLEALRGLSGALRVVIMTGYPTLETAVEGMRLGARDYLTKPFTPGELRKVIEAALEGWAPSPPSLRADDGEVERLDRLVARSAQMRGLFQTLRRVARTDATVLITGESGTGKELVARAIHQQSRRAEQVFVPVNCSALVDSLMESELFGHLKGAFTGATSQKSGLFQYADKGTLFLDEIGDLALSLQPKLLRVLQEGEIKPVGGVRGVPVDVRIIAATHRDLEGSVQGSGFREDLFYRLNVFHLRLPPLRERREDIEPLAESFLEEFSKKLGRGPLKLEESTRQLLLGYEWPGNVRELRNTLLRAATLSAGEVISPSDLTVLSPRLQSHAQRAQQVGYVYDDLTLDEVERRHILWQLEKFGDNRSQTARVLGINRTTLWKKLIKYGIEND
jgi:DNA-binding NtrC family response regulator